MGRDSEGLITRRVKNPEAGAWELTTYSLEETDIIDADQPTPESTLQEARERMIVTSWQFKKALTRSGAKRGQVNAFVSNPNTGDATVDQDIKDGWESAGTYERMNATVLYIQIKLGWTDGEVDALFELAATL